ncbi:hypothetical protein KEM60_03323 [Austwickia sp. TVS 96-490-7B]|nr:hypothetical protein [Austwickia sp. TVS 96-490-7B]
MVICRIAFVGISMGRSSFTPVAVVTPWMPPQAPKKEAALPEDGYREDLSRCDPHNIIVGS